MTAPLKSPGARPPPASTTASARLAEVATPAPPPSTTPPSTTPAPNAALAEPVLGHRYAGPAVREKAARPSPTDGLIKKLEKDPGFGAGLLEGLEAGDVKPAELVGTIGDVFNDKKRARLGELVGRLAALVSAQPTEAKTRTLAALDERFGEGVSNAVVNFSDDPALHTGHFAGRVAAAGELGRRTQIAQISNQLGEFLDELTSSAAREADAKRPRPTKTGGEGQYELAGRPLRPDGRISGRRFAGEHRATEIARVRALGIGVDTDADALLQRLGVSAAFDHQAGKILVRSDATALEWFHELTHALQWKELGAERYLAQPRFERELHVFRAIRDQSADFNRYEFEAAKNYILRLAEGDGRTLPREVSAW